MSHISQDSPARRQLFQPNEHPLISLALGDREVVRATIRISEIAIESLPEEVPVGVFVMEPDKEVESWTAE